MKRRKSFYAHVITDINEKEITITYDNIISRNVSLAIRRLSRYNNKVFSDHQEQIVNFMTDS